MIKINCIAGYEIDGIYQFYVINYKKYRKNKIKFFVDRRRVPEAWAMKAVAAWKARGEQWFSAPFDGVWDFQLIINNKPR